MSFPVVVNCAGLVSASTTFGCSGGGLGHLVIFVIMTNNAPDRPLQTAESTGTIKRALTRRFEDTSPAARTAAVIGAVALRILSIISPVADQRNYRQQLLWLRRYRFGTPPCARDLATGFSRLRETSTGFRLVGVSAPTSTPSAHDLFSPSTSRRSRSPWSILFRRGANECRRRTSAGDADRPVRHRSSRFARVIYFYFVLTSSITD